MFHDPTVEKAVFLILCYVGFASWVERIFSLLLGLVQ